MRLQQQQQHVQHLVSVHLWCCLLQPQLMLAAHQANSSSSSSSSEMRCKGWHCSPPRVLHSQRLQQQQPWQQQHWLNPRLLQQGGRRSIGWVCCGSWFNPAAAMQVTLGWCSRCKMQQQLLVLQQVM
jgi:hypothetical protein